MKPFILITLCCAIIISCKKEHTTTPIVESSQQVLTKIIKTADYGSGTFSLDFAYNNAGKLIKEGNTTYERDQQQRIVRILNPGTSTNRVDIQVHYNPKNANQVDYTFCKMTNIDATDSVVYLHDNSGRLIKTMSYFTYLSDPYIPDTTHLDEYDIFRYDINGNLIQADDYKIDYQGKETHCWQYFFLNYDKGANPLYTGDEVRVTDLNCGSLLLGFYGVINNSMNNCTTTTGNFSKLFEYRADGRPKSCLIQQNGKNVFRLLYEYK